MASLGSLYFDIKFNSDPKELEEMKQNVLKQLAELEVKFGINPSISKEHLVNDINQVLNEKFKLNLLVDKEEVNNAINDAYNSAQKSTRSVNQEDIGYVEDLLSKLKELEIQYKKLEKGGDATPIIQSYKELKAELDDYGKNLANATKRQDLAEGSIVSLRAELSKLIREYDQLGKAGRESDVGQGLLQNIQKTTIALNEAEQASMRYQRNVGNYKSAWNGLQFQLQQLGRELPSIAYGANIFFAAISNNLPMFMDEVKKAQLEFKALKEAQRQGMMLDQKAVPVWKQIVGGIFSWQTAMVALITVMTLYGGKLVDMIFKTKSASKANNEFVKSLKSGNNEYGNAVKEIARLEGILNNVDGRFITAKEAVDEYNKSIGKNIGFADDLNTAQQTLIDKKDEYLKVMFQMAMANSFLAQMQEKAAEAAAERGKTEIKWMDKFGEWFKQYSDYAFQPGKFMEAIKKGDIASIFGADEEFVSDRRNKRAKKLEEEGEDLGKLYMEAINKGYEMAADAGIDLISDDKKKDGKGESDKALKGRLDLLKNAYDLYKEWMTLGVGRGAAINVVNDMLGIDFNPDEYRKNIESIMQKAGKKDNNIRIEAARILMGLDKDTVKESIDKSLVEIEQYIQEAKKNWSFYREILKSTGRKDIAGGIAFNGIEQNVESLVKELKSAIDKYSGSLDIDMLFGMSGKELSERFGEKSGVIKTLLKELRNAMSEEAKEENDIYIESLNSTMGYYDKRIKIIEEYARKIEIANKKGDSITAGKLASERDSKLLEIDPNTILFYTAILSLTKSQAVDIANNLKTGLVKQMEAGVISAEEFSDTLDKINRQLDMSRKNAGALSSYMKEGAEGLMKWFSDTGSSYQQKGASDYKVAQEDYLRYLSEFNDAMKLGDTMSANIAQNGMDMSNSSMESANGMMKMGEGMQNFASKAQGALQMVDMIVTAIDQGVKAMQQLVDSFADLAESRGIDTDEGNWANVKGYMGIMSEFNEKTKASWDSFKSGDAAGATSNLISSWTGFFAGLNRLGDRKLDKEIEKSALEVERMRDAYAEIERTLRRTFGGSSDLNKKQKDLLKGQLSELEKQKRLEEDKKDTDQKKIDDYNRQIAELKDDLKFFSEDLANELLGIDLKGWASQLGDALFEAWKKGEDGAQAFKQKAAEIMGDVMNEILKIQILEPLMEDVRIALFGKDGAGGYFGKDYILDESEMKGLVKILMEGEKKSEAYYQALDQLNDYMEKNYGVSLKDKEAKKGLTSGIKGVTEDTASLIASYMNAIRADGAKRTSLFEILINDRIPEINVFAKAQLIQMQQIATNTGKNASMAEEIRDLFSAVITGTKSIKVT